MYGLLHQLQGKSGQKGGFIHIPYLPEQAAAHPAGEYVGRDGTRGAGNGDCRRP